MLTAKRTIQGAVAVSALALCLAAVTDPAHAQRRRSVARHPADFTTVTDLDNATRFTREVVNVPIRGSDRWQPPHVAGDKDFAGHGPEVWVRVQFLVHNNAVYRRVYMAAVETHSTLGATFGDNKTTAKGWSHMKLVWRPPAGKTIVELRGISERSNLVHDVLKGSKTHRYQTAVGEALVRAYSDAGYDKYNTTLHAQAIVDYHYDLPVVLQNGPSDRVQVQLPRTLKYEPPHTGTGDSDYHGHGPKVAISVYIRHDNRQITLYVYMRARETQADWTTQVGRLRRVIYTAPAGKRIKAVLGKQQWPNLVSYVDDDHEVDVFSDPLLGLIHVTGDTYDENGLAEGNFDYAKVVFSDIRHSLLVDLENE